MDISFIILTYNSEKDIKSCIDSYVEALNAEGLFAEFLIADNGSKDKTVEILEKRIANNLPRGFFIRLIKFNKNLGTTKARNILISKAKAQVLVVCDSDTKFINGSWREGIKLLFSNQDIGIMVPHIFYESGKTQDSVKKFPVLTDKLDRLKTIFFGFKSKTTDLYEDFPWTEIRDVDTAISAFWMLKRSFIDEIGFFDEKIFYSPEDIDFCLRSWEKRRRVVFYPMLKVMHKTQQISHAKPFSNQALSHLFGLIYYFFKHSYFFSRNKLYRRLGLPIES